MSNDLDAYFADPPPPEPERFVKVRNTSSGPFAFISAPGERPLQIDPDAVVEIPARFLTGAAKIWLETGALQLVEGKAD